MPDSQLIENEFIIRLTEIINDNISNEQFGVSELADKVGMSRSNLLRKVKKITNLSVSQFIREVRLKRAMELCIDSSLTSSEISYKVGFSSPSYFIKCFKDYYGYPPGEAEKNQIHEIPILKDDSKNKRNIAIIVAGIIVALVTIALFIFFQTGTPKTDNTKKSIAVLPFINDSNDSSNIHIINGLMESILNKLQKIENLKVVSRTSVEKYRNSPKLIPEIAKELNVSYILEGSGQKVDDQILLNIQLIEAKDDNHLWAQQYRRKSKDIFDLQMEIAKSIADEIQVIITPEEEERINKVPTHNLVAYDYFLKGLDLLYKGNHEDLEQSIIFFKKAIEHDKEFARAYADVAIAYYLLDAGQTEKKYSDEINTYSDNALYMILSYRKA